VALTATDRVWNRAALERGGAEPREGDRALAALLRVHGDVRNGGFDHAVDCLGAAELREGLEGYRWFGLSEAAAVVEEAMTARGDDRTGFDERYAAVVPSDATLADAFERAYRARPEAFAPPPPAAGA
jgi:hypothetical protein